MIDSSNPNSTTHNFDKVIAGVKLRNRFDCMSEDQLYLIEVKIARYDALQDRWTNQNEKHFDELCGYYFEDDVV